MMTLFDDEYILKAYVKSERHEANKETALRMYEDGDSVERIAKIFGISVKEAEEWLEVIPV